MRVNCALRKSIAQPSLAEENRILRIQNSCTAKTLRTRQVVVILIATLDGFGVILRQRFIAMPMRRRIRSISSWRPWRLGGFISYFQIEICLISS